MARAAGEWKVEQFGVGPSPPQLFPCQLLRAMAKNMYNSWLICNPIPAPIKIANR